MADIVGPASQAIQEYIRQYGVPSDVTPEVIEVISNYIITNTPRNLGFSVVAGYRSTHIANPTDIQNRTSSPPLGTTGEYIEFGDLKALVDAGSVLYNPATGQYSINVRENQDGTYTLVAPLDYTLGQRFSGKGGSFGVNVRGSQTTETKRTLTGQINTDLLTRLNSGLNDPTVVSQSEI